MGYLSQDFGVYPRGSVYDMLDHMAVLKGVTGVSERRATVESLFQQVNLSGVRRKAVAGFSGGMRQRFGIAPIAPGYRISEVIKDGSARCGSSRRRPFSTSLLCSPQPTP